MKSRVLIAAILSICSATSVSAKCTICPMGGVMAPAGITLPANTISFVSEEASCFIIELKYVNVLNETDANCTIVQKSTAPSLCGCSAAMETLPNVTSYNVTKSQVNLTLNSVAEKMENATIEEYEKVLTTFYKTYLAGKAINVSAKVHKQALIEPKTRRLQETAPSLSLLNTTINITGTVDTSSKLAYSGNFSDLCANITKNNSAALISALKAADLAGSTSYYANLSSIGASKIVPSSKPKTISTKKPELPKAVTAGIMIGIFAALCAAVYVASLGQGERLLQREIAREQREAAMKERVKKTEQAKKIDPDDDIDEA